MAHQETEMNISTVTMSVLKQGLKAIWSLPDKDRMATTIWGKAGQGKSESVFQLAKEMKFEKVSDIRVAVYDPTDLKGVPYIDGQDIDGVVQKKFLRWMRDNVMLPTDPDAKWVIFLDEITSGSPLVMAMCYQLVLDGKLADYVLPKGCRIVMASNRKSDRGVVNQMPAPLRNRSVHFNLETSLSEWVSNYAIPNKLREDIIGFLRFQNKALHDFEPDYTAFPSHRMWTKLSKILDNLPTDAPKDVTMALINGCVGKGYGSEFNGFQRVYKDLPDINHIIANPTIADVPNEGSVKYALTGTLARQATPENFTNIATYSARLGQEFQTLLCMDAIKLKPELKTTKGWIKVACDIQDVVF